MPTADATDQTRRRRRRPARAAGPLFVHLSDESAEDAGLAGSKAAALARIARLDIATLDGVVLTTRFTEEIDHGATVNGHQAVRDAFRAARGEHTALVVRSSSVVEDQAGTSKAGQFESVVGVRGLEEFEGAVAAVLASRKRAGADGTPIAVLVQPLVEPVAGGVLFGVDPVTGRSDRRVVTAVAGGPDRLVSGEVDGSRYVLDESGAVLDYDKRDGAELEDELLAQLVTLAKSAEAEFGTPQDIEWAWTGEKLLLLQSRPVTTEIRGKPSGPVYGPGPVAETFPEPLSLLEQDMWVPPLGDALRSAVVLAGAARRRDVEHSDVVVVVDGVVAIDLGLTDASATGPSGWRRFIPVVAARRLRMAWRLGRLRAALPALCEDLLDRTDDDLASVPPLDELTSRQLVAVLGRARGVLRSLHAHEMLMGLLLDPGENRMTGASVALRILAEARREGRSDEEIIERSPVVLALTPPRVGPVARLPEEPSGFERPAPSSPASDAGVLREALRLRVRWVQELTGRAAWLLGARLADSGVVESPDAVRSFPLEALAALVTERGVPVPELLDEPAPTASLPARFQLDPEGRPVPVVDRPGARGGTGAGGGRGEGIVTHDDEDPPEGSVLVVATLRPGLGPLLPGLAGIVAETGSVLAHLAILAREAGVPTVVGYEGAREAFPEGTRVVVDGDGGSVTTEEQR